MPATRSAIDELRDNLALGLGIVSRIWDYKTKDWVTSVWVADVDKDGKAEVVVCTREGRVFFLSTEKGGDKWERVVGDKTDWVSTGTVIGDRQLRIIIGKRDGKVYCLDKDGNTVTRDGKILLFTKKDGRAADETAEQEAHWFQAGDVARQVLFDEYSSLIIVGSEDRYVYGLDSVSGELRWKFAADDWVQTVAICDINGDKVPEILIGSADKFLYVLNLQGQVLAKHDMKFPVNNIVAGVVDQDGRVEMLVSTEGKDLAAVIYDASGNFIEKWRIQLHNRVLCLCAVDIDGDGKIEIIASSEDEHTYIFDERGHRIWRHNHHYRVYSLFPYDIDNDGLPELLMGSDDNAVRAMRIRLRRGVDKKIRDLHKRLGKPNPEDIEGLSLDEQDLLEEILGSRKNEQATLQQAKKYREDADYIKALVTVLKLQQQHAQPLWFRDNVGHIRTISFRQIKNSSMRQIITGNTDGRVQAFKADKAPLWSKQFHSRIIDMQTGYIDHNRQEDIVVCSSDKHIYILNGTGKKEPRKSFVQKRMSSLCIAPPQNQHSAQIIIGSEEQNLYALGSDLKGPAETLNTEGIKSGIRLVRTHTSQEIQRLEIVVGSLDNHVYAYTRAGKMLWDYQTYDHILAICLKDIDGDGNIEIMIGSEDRNIHVLDHTGQLLWRYYLPDSALSIDAANADHDGNIEIFVGCGDGYMYVFNRAGDFLWKYEAHDRIHALRVDDLNGDGLVEIALGAEDKLEVLQVVDPGIIDKMIEECWQALCKEQPAALLLDTMLHGSDSLLRAFALQKFSEQKTFSASDFEQIERFAKDHAPEVRKVLVRATLEHYPLSPTTASRLFESLRVDPEEDVINTFAVNLPDLTRYDWGLSLGYLKHFAENDNRYVRRQTVRVLYRLIDFHHEISRENQRQIFELLLKATLDEMEWVRQEAARTIAHFLDRYHEWLIVYVQRFITKEVKEEVLLHIASLASTPIIKDYLRVVVSLQARLGEENVLEKTQKCLDVLDEVLHLKFGKDLRLIYGELYHLLAINSIHELALYQGQLNIARFAPGNRFAQIIMDIFKEVSLISRLLRSHLRRDSIADQLASLLDVRTVIEKTEEDLEEVYSRQLKGDSIWRLPDHQIFALLLQRWHRMVDARLKELGGKAKLTVELMANQLRYEDQVAIWVAVSNSGRSSASNVRITLLQGDDYSVVGKKMFDFETVAPQDNKQAEFVIEPGNSILNLRFEVVYDDAERTEKDEVFDDQLELSTSHQEFRHIPNPYTTGTPIQDSKMFFGREAEIAYLKDNLSREAKTVIILYAHRRYGKTTLLLQLANIGALDRHIPVLIDMQRISYHIDIQRFLYKVAYAIAQAMKKNRLSVCDPKYSDFANNPTHDFIVFLESLDEALGDRKLILLIDEFEVLENQVTKKNLEPEIFDYLRDILQHRQNINFLFSGAHQIIEHTGHYSSTFFNIARHYKLNKLSKEGADALIQQPVAGYLEYEPLTSEKIHQLTNDQPYLIHLMCRAIVDYCNKKEKTFVTINDVNTVLREVMQTIHHYFNWLKEQVSREEVVILSALAEGGREDGHWLTLDELIELYQRFHIPFRREYLLDCLRKLIDFDLVENQANDPRDSVLDSSRFRIPVGLIRRWFLREWPLNLARGQVVEEVL